ncbi:MAG: hypothetical protein COT45_06415 [bacterium (Candidatus Stahlbacteria) CG08_land_8_20_14_0_20_40_26]|nr:MAG: hypothetical protein COX49_09750 [bacterium (Candidatus Stahlbacteria) CG23_combo_of_CG06-09_8_20_14_all_40_9]PIS23482.1 MAG: hypothetical protein COT45_06415 [bacterium (Candidatus Stahlbacteria) CG08_land_8_20_14_0_20_40_26]
MIRKATVGVFLGVALVLACANPVKVGLQGLQSDVNSLAEKIEAGVLLTEQVAALEQEVTAKPAEEFLSNIEELNGEIEKVVLLEAQLTTIGDSLAVLDKSPRATEPLKKDISALSERIEELAGKVAVLREADAKLDELEIKIEEAKKPE